MNENLLCLLIEKTNSKKLRWELWGESDHYYAADVGKYWVRIPIEDPRLEIMYGDRWIQTIIDRSSCQYLLSIIAPEFSGIENALIEELKSI